MLNRFNRSAGRFLPMFIAAMCGMFLLRMVFHGYNSDLLHTSGTFPDVVRAYWWGIRYDLAVLFPLFLSGLLLHFAVGGFASGKWLQRAITLAVQTIGGAILLIAVADIPYYRFNGRRATREVFDILFDSSSAFLSFLSAYALFVLLAIALLTAYGWIARRSVSPPRRATWLPVTVLAVLFCLALNFGRPLTPRNVTFYVAPAWAPVVCNTPMTLAYSILKRQQQLERKNYFAEPSNLMQRFTIRHRFKEEGRWEARPVIIFVLESFSREYLIDGHPNKAPTPFLDSLMHRSIVFDNAYANGTTSSYGLMSILGGIPPFLDEPYFSSIYGSNQLLGIGTLLAGKGYETSFFYGAERDHYGFKKNMRLLGIDHYFSREDYPGDAFDGQWGVYDEPFFLYASKVLQQQKQPVFATIFNISTHFPYMVPPELRDKLPAGTLPSHQSIAYTDRALRSFFESIEGTALKEDAIFVFLADHWAKMREMQDKSSVGIYRIPLFLHDPRRAEGKVIEAVVDQVDIVPGILDYLGYSGPLVSFGSSLFDTAGYRFTYNEFEHIYQLIDSSYVLSYDEQQERSFGLYDHRSDPELSKNLLTAEPKRAAEMEGYLRAVIQTYNNSLIDNQLYPE